MQITNYPAPKTAVKNIQPAHFSRHHYHPNQPNLTSLNNIYPSSSQQHYIPTNTDSYTNDATEENCLLQHNGYSIHLATSLKQRIKVSTLIKRMYASRGYSTESTSIFSHNPNEFTFLTIIGKIVAGTLTLRLDSAQGLLADTLYQSEIDTFRKQGKKVCELSKLVLNPQHGQKEMIAVLFQFAYIYARNLYQATDFFCEVNPRHALPQKRMFGFQQIGYKKICPRVNAPAVLLHLDHASIKKQIEISGVSPRRNATNGSLYPHCIPQLLFKIGRKHVAQLN